MIKITIPGHPLVLKNSKQLIRVNGRTIIKSNPRVEAYQHRALGHIISSIGAGNIKTIEKPVRVAMSFYGAWKSGQKNLPDMSNLYQLPEDLLQASGVLADDNLIENHDGSRRIRMCDNCGNRKKKKSGGFHPDCGAVKTCPFERVEIFIEVLG